jgi:hypothetical protein
MSGQKPLEISVGDPNQSVDPVGDQEPFFDPAANGSFRHADALGDLRDREEFRRRFWLVSFHPVPSSTLDAATLLAD